MDVVTEFQFRCKHESAERFTLVGTDLDSTDSMKTTKFAISVINDTTLASPTILMYIKSTLT